MRISVFEHLVTNCALALRAALWLRSLGSTNMKSSGTTQSLLSNLDGAEEPGCHIFSGRNWLPSAKWRFNHRTQLTDTGVWLGGTRPPTLRVATLQTDLSHQKHAKQRSWCKFWLLSIRGGFVVVLLCLKISGKGNLAALCFLAQVCHVTEQKAKWNQLALYGVAMTALWPHDSNTRRHSSKRHQETEWFHFFLSEVYQQWEKFNRNF